MRKSFEAASALLLAVAILLVPQFRAFAQGDVLAEVKKEDFFKEGLAPVRKPASYDLTIVYFMDYQCPSCRKYTPDVERVLREDRRIRVIYRDTPIFGPRSEAAARAAIASSFQGRHEAMHHALMTAPLPLDDQAIRAAARKAGLDWPRLQRDLRERGDDITALIEWNQHLSVQGGISGTPAFIIGNRLADGALEYADMRASIADARREAGVPNPSPAAAAAKTDPVEDEAPAAAPLPPAISTTPGMMPPASPDARSPAADNAPGDEGAGTLLALAVAGLAAIGGAALFLRRSRRRTAL